MAFVGTYDSRLRPALNALDETSRMLGTKSGIQVTGAGTECSAPAAASKPLRCAAAAAPPWSLALAAAGAHPIGSAQGAPNWHCNACQRLSLSANVCLPSAQMYKIAVVGDQSSGKSSLIESMFSFSLPRGGGIVTRTPIQARLHWLPARTPACHTAGRAAGNACRPPGSLPTSCNPLVAAPTSWPAGGAPVHGGQRARCDQLPALPR